MYGLKPMTLEEEKNAPENVKRTRRNKIKLVDWCEYMKRYIDTIESRAKRIPEEDDDSHSKLVDDWARQISDAMEKLDKAAYFGIR